VLEDGEFSSTIGVCGTFESPNAGAFEAAMKVALRASGGIVVDLRRCQYVDSSSMMLLQRYKRSLGEHVTILVSETGRVRRLLEISGLARSLGVRAALPAVGRTV
jgi:anti-anti-sigma factor